jgi:hypothetical protein
MVAVELHLDKQTFEHIERMAARRRSTVEMLLKDVIEFLATAEAAAQATDDTLLGMFARELELMDEITASAMLARENDPLRLPNG